MITNPGQGENILGQQTFANQTKKEKKFTSLKSLSCSLYISRPKTLIKRLSLYMYSNCSCDDYGFCEKKYNVCSKKKKKIKRLSKYLSYF